MEYFIISEPTPVKREIEIVNHLLKNHQVTFHLRKPDFSKQELAEYLNKIPAQLHPKITIHSHHSLINDFKLKGIHFTHRNKKNIDKYSDFVCTKSISTHSYNEILPTQYNFDYYFLSPIFKSVSKPGYGGDSFEHTALKQFLNDNSNKQIVALGGINHQTIQKACKLGFYGVAILGTFWQFCKDLKNINDMNIFFKTLNYHTNSI